LGKLSLALDLALTLKVEHLLKIATGTGFGNSSTKKAVGKLPLLTGVATYWHLALHSTRKCQGLVLKRPGFHSIRFSLDTGLRE
jgi:hypothetical protein